MMATSLGDNDLLTAIRVPSAAGRGNAYVKFSHPASRYAVIGVAASIGIGTTGGGWMAKIKGEPKETVCTDVSVAIGGLVPKPLRCSAVEAALKDQAPSERVFAAAAAAVSGDLGDDLLGDVFASGDYRKAVASVYVQRAIEAAAGRVG